MISSSVINIDFQCVLDANCDSFVRIINDVKEKNEVSGFYSTTYVRKDIVYLPFFMNNKQVIH
jgi:hypothetical protein